VIDEGMAKALVVISWVGHPPHSTCTATKLLGWKSLVEVGKYSSENWRQPEGGHVWGPLTLV